MLLWFIIISINLIIYLTPYFTNVFKVIFIYLHKLLLFKRIKLHAVEA